MANQIKDEQTTSAPITMTMEQFLALIAETRKPVVDPDLVARNERAKVRLRQQREASERDKETIELSCTHLRDNGSARIAWIENYYAARKLYIREGFCQACNRHFHPDMKDKEEYLRVSRLPIGHVGIYQ